MKKFFGILGLLIFVCLLTGLLNPERFLSEYNIGNLVRRNSLFAHPTRARRQQELAGSFKIEINLIHNAVQVAGAMYNTIDLHEIRDWPKENQIISKR